MNSAQTGYVPYGSAVVVPTYVPSIDDVKARIQPANILTGPYFLESDNVFLTKEKDRLGEETIRAYRFEEIPLASENSSKDYVTKADFDAFAEKIMGVLNEQRAIQPEPATQQ